MANLLENKKLKLEYPCLWQYKIVVLKDEKVEDTVISVVNREYKLKESKNSKNGKYKSFNLELLVDSEEDRVSIFNQFKKCSDIKMVL